MLASVADPIVLAKGPLGGNSSLQMRGKSMDKLVRKLPSLLISAIYRLAK